jgi:hypothetical protein
MEQVENRNIPVCNLNLKLGICQITSKHPQIILVKFT